MAVVESQVSGLELEKVLPKVRVLFERDGPFYTFIKKRPAEVVSNRQMRIPLEIRPGGAFQYFDPNGGDLGRGGGPTWDKAVVTPVFMSENIEYTKLTQWSTDSDRKAVLNGVKRLTATALTELQRQIDSQLMQAGTGQIGTIGSASTSAGVDTYVLTNNFGARLMRYGQVVQVYDATMATFRGKAQITFHDTANQTIKVEPAVVGAIATDVLITDGINSPTALPALYGVPYHHSNSAVGTWLGFSRASTPEIRSNRVNAGGSALSLPLPRLALNKVGDRVGSDNNFNPTAWMHPAQMAAFEAIGQSIMIINKDGGKESPFNPYFSDNMQFAGSPAKKSYNWDKSRIDFISPDVWGRAEMLPIGFYKTDGRNIFELRGASGGVATADIFYMVVGFQTFVNNPAATAYIDNLAIPAGYGV